MDRSILVHVGFHKTGTTWLQNALFREEFGYRQLLTAREIHDLFVAPNYFSFDEGKIKDKLSERTKGHTVAEVDVVSSEILCGNPFYGGRETDVFAERIKKVFPATKILIGIREQVSAIRSVYMQYISRGGTLTAEKFFESNAEMGYHKFSHCHFMYDRIVSLYQDMFGVNNVLVITQEELARERSKVVEQIAAFTSNTANISHDTLPTGRVAPSYPESIAPILRRINHFRSGPVHLEPVFDLGGLAYGAYKSFGKLSRLRQIERFSNRYRPVSRVVKARFGGKFVESNKTLKQIAAYDLDLSRYEGCEP